MLNGEIEKKSIKKQGETNYEGQSPTNQLIPNK